MSAPDCQKSNAANPAVTHVVINFTYDVCGSLIKFKKFLLANRLN